jgi:GTP-binding protein
MASSHAGFPVLDAEFLCSAHDLAALPPEASADRASELVPEVAFAGRSNVGKSSLINCLLGRRKLARVSATPGCTRCLSFLRVAVASGSPRSRTAAAGGLRGLELRFVDLPGYGYAAVSHQARRSWAPLIEGYLERRGSLRAVVLIVDPRRGLEEEEIDLCRWLGRRHRPLELVLTKADKLAHAARGRALAQARAQLAKLAQSVAGRPACAPLFFSAQSGEGREALWRAILDRCRRGTADAALP